MAQRMFDDYAGVSDELSCSSRIVSASRPVALSVVAHVHLHVSAKCTDVREHSCAHIAANVR